MNLPYFWSGMSFCAKAAWLCSTHRARNYSHACQILAGMRSKRPKPPKKDAPQKFWWRERD